MTTRDDQLSGWTKKTLQSTTQSQTAPKRILVPVWSSAALLIHYIFVNPGKSITFEKYIQKIDEMCQKLQCLQLMLVNSEGQILLQDSAWLHVAQSKLQKLNELGYEVLPHLP